VSPDILEARIHEILEQGLTLEDGEMMMPLKVHEIETLFRSIRDLVNDAVREVTQ
jgi:hypothetical protein